MNSSDTTGRNVKLCSHFRKRSGSSLERFPKVLPPSSFVPRNIFARKEVPRKLKYRLTQKLVYKCGSCSISESQNSANNPNIDHLMN